jgi:hypothetical protein
MTIIDLSDLGERAKAVQQGYIWSAPDGAIQHALRDIAAGRIAAPASIPAEWQGYAESVGIDVNALGGLAPESGPA